MDKKVKKNLKNLLTSIIIKKQVKNCQRGWWNGRHAGLRDLLQQCSEGSNPFPRTI